MQKEYKTWVSWIFIVLTSIFLFNCILNIFANMDGLFSKVNKKNIVSFGRYSHIEYLLNNKEKYNSILLGGSRVGVISTDYVEKNIENTNFFNINYGSGSMKEFYLTMDYLGNNIKLNNVILLISPDNMKESDEKLFRTMHYKIIKENKECYYFKRVISLSGIKEKIKRIYYNINGKDDGYFSNSDGTWKYQIVERKILRDIKKYYREENTFNIKKDEINIIKGNKIDENIYYLKKIVDICKQKKIKLTVIMAPVNQNHLVRYNIENYIEFLKRITEETDYWDFSGYNSITTNNYNYYEIAHYRYFIGNMIIQKIFAKEKIEIPYNFGEYVTKKNIEEHIKNREKNIEEYIKRREK